MFSKILIANRGEIACRIMRTARRLGIGTVAVYSAADAAALHVKEADEALAIGPAPSAQSYLDGAAIVAAAQRAGAQAIHPGYGFLSENAEFARRCNEARIVFIGPSVPTIEIMGSKSAAKTLMAQHQVPMVPGYYGADQSTSGLTQAAKDIGLPLLIKASAGGGGRGMRIVRNFSEFAGALASAQREASSAFGDPSMLLERYIERPRHIEVQIFGDTHGNLVHLYERDCSLQRRHQKVIEEAPALGLSAAQREALLTASLTAGAAVNYVGAGTVEFILDQTGQIYFIEMNTRLQVEHPVTEAITGIDLVEWQLRVAAGQALPLAQHAITSSGHAIEVRVYAEDPAQDFHPSIGRIDYLRFPEANATTRIDTGFTQHDVISPYYDAMLAKIICHDATRIDALNRLREALRETQVVGITTNVDYLQRIITHPAYIEGGFDTHFVEACKHELVPDTTVPPLALVFAALVQFDALSRRNAAAHSPWDELTGFRLNAPAEIPYQFLIAEKIVEVRVRKVSMRLAVILPTETVMVKSWSVLRDATYRLELDDQTVCAEVIDTPTLTHVFLAGQHHRVSKVDPWLLADEAAAPAGNLTAPMPGAIRAVLVKIGDTVERGAPLMVLEAMKIEHTICAPLAGTVTAIRFSLGEQVTVEGAELLTLEPITAGGNDDA